MPNEPINVLHLPNDPLFYEQWHLRNTGQTGGTAGVDLNVVDVWRDYTGRGVRVGILDDGIEYTHPDLWPNYDRSIDYDAADQDDDARPRFATEAHGMAIAGIIGAVSHNGLGGVGVAPGARIAGIRVDFEPNRNRDDQWDRALQQMVRFDVVNNSWGFGYPFMASFLENLYQLQAQAIQTAVQQGRNGLGTTLVFAGGNSRGFSNTNYANFSNSRFVTTVAALNHHGTHTWYSNPGASILVSAFGGDKSSPAEWDGIVTTDRIGEAGYGWEGALFPPLDYTNQMDGTSAAAPMVAGVVALMLEANPRLGYRDIQEILAYSARQNHADDQPTDPAIGWQFNGATNWNGGGLHTHLSYGFGLVDAKAAVRLAETWITQKHLANEQRRIVWRDQTVAIPDRGEITQTLSVTNGLEIDQVEVFLNIDHTRIGDLSVTLTSPNGTQSILVDKSLDTSFGAEDQQVRFVLSSTQFWGETGVGNWTLKIEDQHANNVGMLRSWSLRLYGDANTANDTYIYTDEFANFSDLARRTLTDTVGIDTLNAAAVTSDLTLNLMAGSTSTIAGNTLLLTATTAIEQAIGGDGDDELRGNSLGNRLNGQRGQDMLMGGAGSDQLLGERGDDRLTGEAGFDTLSGGQGRDRFIFSSGGVFNSATLGTDRITDFATGSDAIVLSKTTFSALRSLVRRGFSVGSEFAAVLDDTGATRSNALIVYSQSSGNLYYNPNGSAIGFGTGGRFATVDTMIALQSHDFMIQV